MKALEVRSARLILRPRTEAEMLALRDAETDPEDRKAYSEMLELMRKKPEAAEWACDWRVSLPDGTEVGGAGFKGAPDADGSVEIGYATLPAHRRRGYAAEYTAALSAWALAQPGVKRVLAQTEPDNTASQRTLARCGFTPCGMGEEGPLFALCPADN